MRLIIFLNIYLIIMAKSTISYMKRLLCCLSSFHYIIMRGNCLLDRKSPFVNRLQNTV